jgi:hypothetical protein
MQARQKLLECFNNCDHFFIISSQCTFVGNRRPYLGFIECMSAMHTIARRDKKTRRISWIVDQMGSRYLLTGVDVRKFDNIQQLRSRLLAWAIRYGDSDQVRWLCDHGRVFVRNENAIAGPLDSLFGDSVPENWAADAAFCNAYGDDHAHIQDLSISAFWLDGALTCYAWYVRDDLPYMVLLPFPGEKYANTLQKFMGDAQGGDQVRSFAIPDFIDTF